MTNDVIMFVCDIAFLGNRKNITIKLLEKRNIILALYVDFFL